MARARLPFSNRYVFAKVMRDNPEICRQIIERVLGLKISHVELLRVEDEVTSIKFRSVRFDVFLESDEAAFEVEMQAYDELDLPKRMRFYRSRIDAQALRKGEGFGDLRPVYVIFVCLADPFGEGLPVYTFRSACVESPGVAFDNGAIDVVLNTAGDLSRAEPGVASLLEYIGTNMASGNDALTTSIERAVADAFADEEWVSRMNLIELDLESAKRAAARAGLERGIAEGRAEGAALAQDRNARLAAKMREAGASPERILEALTSSDPQPFYEEYGIE